MNETQVFRIGINKAYRSHNLEKLDSSKCELLDRSLHLVVDTFATTMYGKKDNNHILYIYTQ